MYTPAVFHNTVKQLLFILRSIIEVSIILCSGRNKSLVHQIALMGSTTVKRVNFILTGILESACLLSLLIYNYIRNNFRSYKQL